MKISRNNLLKLQQILEGFVTIRKTVLAYSIAKNLQLLEPEIKAIQEALKPIDRMVEFEKKRQEICIEKSRKGYDGNPIIIDSNFVFDNTEEVIFELNRLKEDYEEDFVLQNEKSITDKAFIDEEIDFYPLSLEISDLPEDLTADTMKTLIGCGIIV